MRVLVLLLLTSPALAAPSPRVPEVIDHSRPERYRVLPDSAGGVGRLRALAKDLRHVNPERTIRNVHAYVASRVPHVPLGAWPAEPDDVPTLLLGFDHTDCARHALLVGSLLRTCGIPVIYVKSTRHDWIRTFVATGETGGFAGHVFLEVHVQGRWKLLDAQGMRIWDRHDPENAELPGGLLAWEKGSDHHAMVHSTRRDAYKEEIRRRFEGFDPSTLRRNDAPGRSLLPPVYALTLDDEWKALEQRIPGLRSFDASFWAERKKGIHEGVLIVTSMGGRVAMPAEDARRWLPVSLHQLRRQFEAGKSGLKAGRRPDGTVVLVLAAPGRDELMRLIWSTDLAKLRARADGLPD